ncbi:tRNA1(Val) (adenine(37)-N6)-methyltransferase [Anaerobacillus alkaliphilus]|uniref:tRNA1(Val) (Adenine(37)-N6)-methyltransferase n=1 Tax=Anaerobacillus alkaliphilus TaxID=1548597 RepID=A0A4Q0VSH8_9BACI|nr:tRNA1(Val) (adenine(37)-N6)-methyltransferase [Anaerobacillus alkaliphilus]RXJ00893.1 tRNA1(Val) (adenine(37)-N6)-methyltransferase [Anaerobacillus alkaliphilus]
MVKIEQDERIDHLPNEKLKIIQSPDVFSFSMDAVFLAKFCYVPIQKGDIVDLCTGNGVIPLLLSERSKAKITGVEIQERLFHMAVRSTEMNELSEQITFLHGDIKNAPTSLGKGKFDLVTCNPPYFKTVTEKEWNENKHFAIARHEIYCDLDDVLRVSGDLVKERGKVAIVHRPDRLIDIITSMKKYQIEPKRIQFVHPKKEREANILLVEGIKNGKSGIKILQPLFVYHDDNTYTEEFKNIYFS